MSTWNDVKVGGGINLLPAGIRNFEITKAEARVNERTGRREAALTLSSAAGNGEETVPLEPWGTTPDAVEMWERIFKSKAQGLGFTPEDGAATMQAITTEFALYVPGLVGSIVEAEVTHVEAKDATGEVKVKDNGEPFLNHRVNFRGVVGTQQAPVFATAAATTGDDLPW